MSSFLQRHARLVGLLVTGCIGLYAVESGVAVVRRSAPEPAATYARAWHEQTVAHRAALAAARQAAVTTRTVYVTKRRSALEAVEALPPAQLAGDTLTIPAGTFTVPHPVALYVAQLQQTVATIPPMIAAADSALLAMSHHIAAQEAVNADLTTENDALTAEVKALHPSRVGRLWNQVKVPAAFLAGAWLGSRVVR